MAPRLRRRDRRRLRERPGRRQFIAILPSMFTLGNAVFGFASIIVASRIHPTVLRDGATSSEAYQQAIQFLWIAGVLIFGGMLCDALDGRVARLARSASKFGAELDSLCDAITFGAAPAFLLLKLGPTADQPTLYKMLFVAATVYVLGTILRLARFNVETDLEEESHLSFKGLPSPAAAGCLASVALIRAQLDDTSIGRAVAVALPFLALVLAYLMVSTIRYPHLVNLFVRGRQPFPRLVQILIGGTIIMLFLEYALPIGFWGFALMGPIRGLFDVPRPTEPMPTPGPIEGTGPDGQPDLSTGDKLPTSYSEANRH